MIYHVVVSSNERYMPGATVAMAGVALNAHPESYFIFHLFSEDVKEDSYNRFESTLLRLHPNGMVLHHPLTENNLRGLPFWATSRMAAARCLYSELLVDVDWCLYLDCDILYLASPEEHFSYRDETKMAVVAPEQASYVRAKECAWIKERCGVIVPTEEYFNSGVVLFNFKLMREERMSDKLLRFFADYADVNSPDQDALNTLFVGRTILLPQKWNLLQHFVDDKWLIDKPVIHYVGGAPWLQKISITANGRFRLWHMFADKYIWQQKGESCRRHFAKRILFLKKISYVILRTPLLGSFFVWILKIFRLSKNTMWRSDETKFIVTDKAIHKILNKRASL